ncbi:MAG: glycine cleavage system aminomethyltransferase GcvT [Bacteroidia bacterium]|nr:glycine cleavage system aminomethyltransferase GcvT [Bacteroidia bacterium]
METTTLKPIPLHHVHLEMGAKMVPFAGFEMPVQYSGVNDEHLCVRNHAGIFDVSHMGEFFISGKDALALIQHITCNDASRLEPGKIQYSALMNEKGGIVDDLLVYCLAPEKYMLVVNAANIEKDKAHILHYAQGKEINFEDRSTELCLFAVQGPKATEILQKLTSVNLSEIPYYHFKVGDFCGVKDIILSNTGYTGAGGFELYIPNDASEKIWRAILEKGKPDGLKPVGLGARDTLRLEMGFCLYGNDITDDTTPLEAGLGWITKLQKGDFVGKKILEQQKSEGLKRKLCGFVMEERGIPRHDYDVADASGKIIGKVTSGTQSPLLQKGIGLAYLSAEFAVPDKEIFILIREKPHKAKVVKIPFIQK